MYYNFFLENCEPFLQVNALKTLILFSKRQKKRMTADSHDAYLKILQNVFQSLHQLEEDELRSISLRYCYVLYDIVDNAAFIDYLLHAYQSYSLD